MNPTFGARLAHLVAERGPLCVGIDPHPALLASWGLPVTVSGLERFSLTVVEALAERVALLKPQSAFFETYGAQGIAVLERVIATARAAGGLTLIDAKRGDIGSTMSAYAQAYLADGAPLAGDAVTLSPYLGFGALQPAIELAIQSGRGVFVLARTSNIDGQQQQLATLAEGTTVAQSIVDQAAHYNMQQTELGSVGVVVGATIGKNELNLAQLNGPILTPGFGAQGATIEDVRSVFAPVTRGVLPASSRDLLRHGPAIVDLRAATQSAINTIKRAIQW